MSRTPVDRVLAVGAHVTGVSTRSVAGSSLTRARCSTTDDLIRWRVSAQWSKSMAAYALSLERRCSEETRRIVPLRDRMTSDSVVQEPEE